jgi:hypothetical protein
MRITLTTPEELNPHVVRNALGLVDVHILDESAGRWTELELALAYDWAWRMHLRASDHAVKQRDKPSFVADAEQAGVAGLQDSVLAALASPGPYGMSAATLGHQLAAERVQCTPGAIQLVLGLLTEKGLAEGAEFGRWKITEGGLSRVRSDKEDRS